MRILLTLLVMGISLCSFTKCEARTLHRHHTQTRQANLFGELFGFASFYSSGQMTASGQRFNPSKLTAAHRSFKFGTRVLVTNRRNGKSVIVTINDRGPFVKGRIIDLSRAAAARIGMINSGVAPVSIARL